jgi:hypothetical protein
MLFHASFIRIRIAPDTEQGLRLHCALRYGALRALLLMKTMRSWVELSQKGGLNRSSFAV